MRGKYEDGQETYYSVYSHTSGFLSLNRGLTCFLKEASNALTSGCIMTIFSPQIALEYIIMFYTFQGKFVFKFFHSI